MMNPFIQALMQQSEQASKDALARQEQGANALGLAIGMMGGGGMFGGEGGLFGGPTGEMTPTLASLNPTAPIEPTYSAPTYSAPRRTPSAPSYTPPMQRADPASQPFAPNAVVPPIVPDVSAEAAAIADKWARNDPGATTPAPLTVNEKWTLNDPGATPEPSAEAVAAAALGISPSPAPAASAPAPANGGGGVGDGPINMAKYLQWSGRDLDMTPEQFRQEGVAMPDWGYVAPMETPSAYTPEMVYNDAYNLWDDRYRNHFEGVDPRLVQILNYARANTDVPFGISDGLRTLDEQKVHLANGATTTLDSRHLRGNAMDVFPLDANGNPDWQNADAYAAFSEAAKRGASELGYGDLNLTWGGDWTKFVDKPHFQIDGYYNQNGLTGDITPWSPNGAPMQGAGWALVGGDPSLYPGTLPDWLSAGQPTETMMTKGQPDAGYSVTGDPMRDGIISTANALGMDPMVLATIISYETGGTMDPLQRGPTTQWGQHRGLIQFGEPQAAQHGVDFTSADTALSSQLGPNGAVASYFRSSGWRPGMSELDAYSIVNAGGPGLYDRSDANNGGAPGTVRDKVEQQFGYHRDAARRLLGAPDAFGVPSTQAPEAQTSGPDNWVNPYNNRNLAMLGGVTSSGGLYHDWGSGNLWAHDNDYEDYSQFYREFTYEPKDGYVPVGERDGRTVYAAPAPEYVNGMPVDRNLYVSEARRRNALIPTEDEMRAFYAMAQPVRMPTIPNGGGPNDRISFDNVPDGPWYGPKEFYRTNDSPALPTTFAEAMRDPRVAQALMQEILMGGH